jgi:hypothetical protein
MRDWKKDKEKKVKCPLQTLITSTNTPTNNTTTLNTSELKRKRAQIKMETVYPEPDGHHNDPQPIETSYPPPSLLHYQY